MLFALGDPVGGALQVPSHDLGGGRGPRSPRPWVGVIRADPAFAAAYARGDADRYRVAVSGMARLLFDRDPQAGVVGGEADPTGAAPQPASGSTSAATGAGTSMATAAAAREAATRAR